MLVLTKGAMTILNLAFQVEPQFLIDPSTLLDKIIQVLNLAMVSGLALDIYLLKNCKLIFQSTG
jgi:hypothetical protein